MDQPFPWDTTIPCSNLKSLLPCWHQFLFFLLCFAFRTWYPLWISVIEMSSWSEDYFAYLASVSLTLLQRVSVKWSSFEAEASEKSTRAPPSHLCSPQGPPVGSDRCSLLSKLHSVMHASCHVRVAFEVTRTVQEEFKASMIFCSISSKHPITLHSKLQVKAHAGELEHLSVDAMASSMPFLFLYPIEIKELWHWE